jgi:hypothetical protein
MKAPAAGREGFRLPQDANLKRTASSAVCGSCGIEGSSLPVFLPRKRYYQFIGKGTHELREKPQLMNRIQDQTRHKHGQRRFRGVQMELSPEGT